MATKPAQTQVAPEIDREKIARIIDPAAFENWHRYYLQRKNADMLEPIVASQAAHYQYGDDIKSAYARADSVLAALPLLPAHEWKGIESAPKDGTEFLGLNMRATVVGYRVVYFDDEAKEPYIWHVEDAGKGFNHHRDFFTHWMPLPTPPSIEKSGSEK